MFVLKKEKRKNDNEENSDIHDWPVSMLIEAGKKKKQKKEKKKEKR